MTAVRRSRRLAPRFSIVSIVRKEAQGLPRLLASLAEFRKRGGEVLVLDTGSTDGTPEIAADAGCRVVVEPRKFNSRLRASVARRLNKAFCRGGEGPFFKTGERLFHFARARAHAASLARNDFQLVVDGSDVVESLDIDAIDALSGSGLPLFAFETTIRARAGWFLEIREGLHDRRATQWRGQAHNFLALRPGTLGARAKLLSRDQVWVSHHTNLLKTRGYQLAGTAMESLADPAADRWRYFLGRDLGGRGAHRSAIELLLGLDQQGVPPTVRSAGLCLAAQNLAACGGSRDEVDTLLFRASNRDSSRRDPLLQLASRQLIEGEMQSAVSFATAALSIPARPGFSEPAENHTTRPHAILYWALLWLGRKEEAREHFERCVEMDPRNRFFAEHARLFDPSKR